MIHLLVVYRRSTQELIKREIFAHDELPAAMAARFDVDVEYWSDDDVEAVVITGESEDAIKVTHGRYFLAEDELVGRMASSAHTWPHLRKPRELLRPAV